MGGTPPPPFTDKIRKVVFDHLPNGSQECQYFRCYRSFANTNICSQVSVKFKVQDDRDTAIISTSKWSEKHIIKSLFFKHKSITWIQRCPMENCTLLVLGRSWNQQIGDLISRQMKTQLSTHSAFATYDSRRLIMLDNVLEISATWLF